ncbi:glycosyltransferase (plasmid) [Limimaricola variabilis]|uniref:glycosyltransferase n=1 Tax=Limimaricola variabilis TaxID=1492771 RepID=UPI002AC8C64A|nr:glycosyltransferase [Limimaricola variabilis]WPY96233.1 glycosyltransferase [Limimaricola variabilis]
MRILIFAPNYLPAIRYGGPVRSTHGLARGLVAAGHEVTVLSTDMDGPGRLEVPLDRAVEMDGVSIHYCPIRTPKRLYYSPIMAQLIDEIVPNMDAVHVNGLFLWPGPRIARTARRCGVPVVISPRGMLMPEMVAGKSRLAKTAWIALQERSILRSARAIHVTSEGEAEGLLAMGRDLAPVTIVPNGVEIPEAAPTAEEIAEIWGDVPPGRRVAFLARLDWTKGVDLAIEAARAHPDAVLRIAGHDQIDLRAKLEPRLRRDDGSSAGAFLGPLDGARKWAFLAGADLLLAPSVRESFGMSVAEALAVGTPACVTPGVGARDLVAEVDVGLVVPREARALTAAMATFLADPVRRKTASTRAREMMAKRYDWRAIAVRMAALYSGDTA